MDLPILNTTKKVIHIKTEQITNSLVEQNNEVINHNQVKTNSDDLQQIVKTAVHYLASTPQEKIRQWTYSSHTTNVARRACNTAQ